MKLTSEEEELIRQHRATQVNSIWKPKEKGEYTVEEKVAFFDKMYDNALRILKFKETNGHEGKDEDHWAYETQMNLLGPGFWDYFNKLGR